MLSNARNGRYLREGPTGKKLSALVQADDNSRIRSLTGGSAFSTEDELEDERRRKLVAQANLRLKNHKGVGHGAAQSAKHRVDKFEKAIADNRASIDRYLDEYQRAAHNPKKRHSVALSVSRLLRIEETIRSQQRAAILSSMPYIGSVDDCGEGPSGEGREEAEVTESPGRQYHYTQRVVTPIGARNPHARRREAILERLRSRILTHDEEARAVASYYRALAEGKDVGQQLYAIFADLGTHQLPNVDQCNQLLRLVEHTDVSHVENSSTSLQAMPLALPEFLFLVDSWKRLTVHGTPLTALGGDPTDNDPVTTVTCGTSQELSLLDAFMSVSPHAGTEEDPHVVEDLVNFTRRFNMDPFPLLSVTSAPDAAGVAVPASTVSGFPLPLGNAESDTRLHKALQLYASAQPPTGAALRLTSHHRPTPPHIAAEPPWDETLSPMSQQRRRLSELFYEGVQLGDRKASFVETATPNLVNVAKSAGRAFSLSVRMANRIVALLNKERVQNYHPRSGNQFVFVDSIVGEDDPSVIRAKGRQTRFATQEQRQRRILANGGPPLDAVVMSHLVAIKAAELRTVRTNAGEDDEDTVPVALGDKAEAVLRAKRERQRQQLIMKEAYEEFQYLRQVDVEAIVHATRFITNDELLCVLGSASTEAVQGAFELPSQTQLLEEFILLGGSDPALPDAVTSDLLCAVVAEGVPSTLLDGTLNEERETTQAKKASAVWTAARTLEETSVLGTEWHRALDIPLGNLVLSPSLSSTFARLQKEAGTETWGHTHQPPVTPVPTATRARTLPSTSPGTASPPTATLSKRNKSTSFDLPNDASPPHEDKDTPRGSVVVSGSKEAAATLVEDSAYDTEDVQAYVFEYLKTLLVDIHGPGVLRQVFRDETTPGEGCLLVSSITTQLDPGSPAPPTLTALELHNDGSVGPVPASHALNTTTVSSHLGGAGHSENRDQDDDGMALSLSDDDSEALRLERKRAREMLMALALPVSFDTYCHMVEMHALNMNHLAVRFQAPEEESDALPCVTDNAGRRGAREALRRAAAQGTLLGEELDEELEGWGLGTGTLGGSGMSQNNASPLQAAMSRSNHGSFWQPASNDASHNQLPPQPPAAASPSVTTLAGPDRSQQLTPDPERPAAMPSPPPIATASVGSPSWEASPTAEGMHSVNRNASMRQRGHSMREGGGLGARSFNGGSRYGGKGHVRGTYESLRLMEALRKTTAPAMSTANAFREHEDMCEEGYFDAPAHDKITIRFRKGGVQPSQQRRHLNGGASLTADVPHPTRPPFRYQGVRRTILNEPRLVDDGTPDGGTPGVRIQGASPSRVRVDSSAADPSIEGESLLTAPRVVEGPITAPSPTSRAVTKTPLQDANHGGSPSSRGPPTARHLAPHRPSPQSTNLLHKKERPVTGDPSHAPPVPKRLSYTSRTSVAPSEEATRSPTQISDAPPHATGEVTVPTAALNTSTSSTAVCSTPRHRYVPQTPPRVSALAVDEEYSERHPPAPSTTRRSNPRGVPSVVSYFQSPPPREPQYTHEHQPDQRHPPEFHQAALDRYAAQMRASCRR